MSITSGGSITLSVDLRSQISGIRDQGQRPLCLICAASDVHEAFHATGFPLSAEYLAYYCQIHDDASDFSEGFDSQTVSAVMKSEGQPSEAFHPYEINDLISAVEPPAIGAEPLHFGKIDEEPLDIQKLTKHLDNQQVVLVGVEITKDFFDVTNSDFIIKDTKDYGGNHAMVVVGHGVYKDEKVFLLRNSWGVGWGYQGYAWVSEDYLTKYCPMMARVERN